MYQEIKGDILSAYDDLSDIYQQIKETLAIGDTIS